MASHPTKIGKYNVEGVLGRGGMGVVYKAVDSQIGRYVAIKMITSGGDASLLERFKSEARSTGSLQCPNIVTVYDFGEQDGNPYLVMQFLEGSSLESLIQKGISLSFSERLGIIIDVCNGLAYAHQRSVIHRDIKPANIMVVEDGVNDGMAVIVDFGIARIGGDTRLTRTDQIIGSVHYMSAEQLQSKELDNRTDIYATGVVLFQLLTGSLPFDSPDTAATLLQIVNDPPPPLSKYLKDYPVELDAIVSRVLAKNREERYANAKELAFDLMQVQDRLKSETVAQLFQRAEVSLRKEEWTRAREHLQQLLRLDRQNTQAQKLMNSVQEQLRKLQRIEQARGLRSQADEAYMDQRYDDALRLLEQALALDGSNSELLTFRDSVRSAKERATGLRRALRNADAALKDGDLDEAENAVKEAFKIDPEDTRAAALNVIIAQQREDKKREEQLRSLLHEARKQITAGHLTAAFNLLKSAEALDPSSNELQKLAKAALVAREQEKRKAEIEALCKQINVALGKDYEAAAALATDGLRKFPQEPRLLELRTLAEGQRLRVEQKKFVREQISTANALADSGQLRQAVAVLERALQRAPGNGELESLRAALLDRMATEESGQQKQEALEATIAEGKRILQEQGARNAIEFLAPLAAEYSYSQPFRELYDAARERDTLDALDGRLARETNPARQLQFAEEALQQNPNHRGIQQRVAELQELRTQLDALINHAQELEAAGQFSEALQLWQQLIQSHPQIPEFKAQVGRVDSLLKRSNQATSTSARPQQNEKSVADYSATRVLGSTSGAPPKAPTTTSTSKAPGDAPQPKQIEPLTAPKQTGPTTRRPVGQVSALAKYLVVAAAGTVLLVVGYMIFGSTLKNISVKIATAPEDSNVTIGSRSCRAPCTLRLPRGSYDLRAEHNGYYTTKQQVSITADMKPLSVIVLTPLIGLPDHGTLLVHTNVDGVDVLVDGNLSGSTGRDNTFQIPLTVGTYQITVRKSGYQDEPAMPVDIAKDEATPLEFALEKPPIATQVTPKPPETYLLIRSQPEANVAIDQRFVGKIPSAGTLSVLVDPKAHKVDVSLPGYKPFSRGVAPKEGARFSIDAKLFPDVPKPQPPRIVSFTPSSASIQAGQSVELSWKTENANQVSIDQNIGRVEPNSLIKVVPKADTTYTLVAKGPDGGPVQQSVKITVAAIPPLPKVSIALFKAALPNIHKGESTTLFWSTQNAVEVFIDQGQGKVDVNGSVDVRPATTTKYVLTAKGQSGEIKTELAMVNVTEIQLPPGTDAQEILKCLEGYRGAYALMDFKEMQKFWPKVPKELEKTFRDKEIHTIIVKHHCVDPPLINGNTAQYQCDQTIKYRKADKEPNPDGIVFVFQKSNGMWVIDHLESREKNRK